MAIENAYAQYGTNKILMASREELPLLLYEGAIKFSNIAIMAIEKKDIEKAHKNIVRVEAIIEYLRTTLDMKYPVAEDFDRIYVYLEKLLVEANVSKEVAVLEEIIMHLRSVRDTWKEVMRLSKKE